jgi:hypothetical protein
VKAEEIKKKIITKSNFRKSECMLEGVIPGANVMHHLLMPDEILILKSSIEFVRILFLCSGSLTFNQGGEWFYDELAVFVPNPEEEVSVAVSTKAELIEIQWRLGEVDWNKLWSNETKFPITQKYLDAVQYKDPFKSDKTISRAIIPQRIIPRFAMGSVETYGDDLIGQHEHPLLDQFFYSFSENHMELLLDDIVYPMDGDTLLHIPLGCNHGVKVTGEQCAHYIWIDFISNEEGNLYLDEVHKETGTKRSFT